MGTNMVSQTMLGYNCELWWGWKRMAFFYISTAFGATLLSSLCSPDSVSVGASGALLGIIGAYMIWILYNWRDRDRFDSPQVACTRMCSTITWLIIIFMIGSSMSRWMDAEPHQMDQNCRWNIICSILYHMRCLRIPRRRIFWRMLGRSAGLLIKRNSRGPG